MTNRRNRHVRVSVRELVEDEDDDWHVGQESWRHVRYQTLRTLSPMSGEHVARMRREGFDADWEGVASPLPRIEDGWMVVTFDAAGDPELYLRVAKRLPRGRDVTLLLAETNEDQS